MVSNMKRLNILGIFYSPKTLDCYTFVLNERDGQYYQMLGTSDTGDGFSQFTSGTFNYHGDNSHLGKQVKWSDLNEELQRHVEGRLA